MFFKMGITHGEMATKDNELAVKLNQEPAYQLSVKDY